MKRGDMSLLRTVPVPYPFTLQPPRVNSLEFNGLEPKSLYSNYDTSIAPGGVFTGTYVNINGIQNVIYYSLKYDDARIAIWGKYPFSTVGLADGQISGALSLNIGAIGIVASPYATTTEQQNIDAEYRILDGLGMSWNNTIVVSPVKKLYILKENIFSWLKIIPKLI